MANIEQLKGWIKCDLGRFADYDSHVHDLGMESAEGREIQCTWRFALFTNDNRYSFVARERKEGAYLGCIASSRKPRAGEDWTRGRDLADGSLSEDTWRKILAEIVSYELVRLAPKVEPQSVQEPRAA